MFYLFFEVLKNNLIFDYNSFGNRINFVATFGGAKQVYDNKSLMLEQSTYYILDAQGNQLSIYEHSVDSASGSVYYYLTDRNIYGSSRLGVTKDTLNMFNPSVLQSYGILGNRNYELTDHRGNVQTVINDIKYPLSSDNTSIDSYEVGISSVADYSPFGVQLDGRTMDNVFYHQNNNNGSQTPADTVEIYNNDFENPPATGSPYYSTEVTLDANLSNASWTSSTGTFTNYNSTGAGSGKSIAITTASADTAYLTLTMDVANGFELDITSYSFAHRSSATGYNSYQLVVDGIEIGSGSIYVATSGSTLQSTGVVNANNTVSGVTGTVNVVLKLYGGTHGSSGTFRMDDFVLNGYVQEESSGYSSSDYFVSRNHRYSFQNQEHHDEIRGKGNYINYKYRGYDPRVGRLDWLIDPLAPEYPWNSPYAFSENRVIDGVELEGLEFVSVKAPFSSTWVTLKYDYNKVKRNLETGIALIRYPKLLKVGIYKYKGTNISSIAGHFALNLTYGTGLRIDEGGEQNALRHVIWSALMTKELGSELAEIAGQVHEGIGIDQNWKIDWSEEFKGDASHADAIVDLLNNEIGRKISEENPKASNKQLASMAINEFQENGLWTTIENDDGTFGVQKTKLLKNEVEMIRDRLVPLNENGLNKADYD